VRYQLFSKYRSELMGAAMLWVMLFHASDLDFSLSSLSWLRMPLRFAGEHSLEIYLLNVSLFSLTDLWHRYLPLSSPYLFWLLLSGLNFLLAALLHRGIALVQKWTFFHRTPK